jgi:hypothetical protein
MAPARITFEASQVPAPPAPDVPHDTTSSSPAAPEGQAAPSDMVPTSDQLDPTAALAPAPASTFGTRADYCSVYPAPGRYQQTKNL